jgi:hypothetical protein
VAQDLALAGGELVELGVLGCGRGAGERVEHEAGQAGREDGVAGLHAGDRVEELASQRTVATSGCSNERP